MGGGEAFVKTVQYRGGIIQFNIPDDWVEEIGDQGAAYYRDRPGSGTLFLNTITTQPREPVTAKHLLEAASAASRPGDSPAEILPNGNALRTYWRDAKEGKTALRIRYWQLAGGAPPTTVRVATFSYAVPAGSQADGDMQILDREIRAAEFTKLTAEEVQKLIRDQKRSR